jgi:hypothetical protein
MKAASIALCLSLLAVEAHAISRYTTTNMNCAAIQAAVQSEGVAILRWQSPRNPSLPLYGRYVANRRFCQMEEVAEIAYVPAADASCPVHRCARVFRNRGNR